MNNDLGEIFVSISDDKTLRIYKPDQDFKLIHTDSTYFCSFEWHTLTYFAL